MSPNRADRILGEWSAVAKTATPPPSPAESLGPRTSGLGISLVGASLLAIALVVGLAWLGGRDEQPSAGDTTPPASEAVVPAPSSTPEPSATHDASPTPDATLNPCVHLSTPLTWEGAAGQRIATITLTNPDDGDCVLGEFERVQYVDAANKPLIEGPAAPGSLTVPANSSVSTLVEIGNYCGPEPEQPVGIVFVKASGGILLIGSPESAADMSVPPCNGPNAPATIQMQPWAPSGQ
jgi:hypothetical protein